MVYWEIWKARNMTIFEGKLLPLRITSSRITTNGDLPFQDTCKTRKISSPSV